MNTTKQQNNPNEALAEASSYVSAIFDEANPKHDEAWESNCDRGMSSDDVRAEALEMLREAIAQWEGSQQ